MNLPRIESTYIKCKQKIFYPSNIFLDDNRMNFNTKTSNLSSTTSSFPTAFIYR